MDLVQRPETFPAQKFIDLARVLRTRSASAWPSSPQQSSTCRLVCAFLLSRVRVPRRPNR